MGNKWILLVLVLGGIFFFNYFVSNKNNPNNENKNNSKIQVIASFYPLYFFAKVIGGDRVDVKNITPAGVEPHDYEPTTQDIAHIEKGDMLILNGSVEGWGDKIRDNLQGTDVKIVTAGEGLLKKEITEGGGKIKDPHIWLAPNLAKIEIAKITAGFTAIDPDNSNFYRYNEKKLDNALDTLDTVFKKGLQDCQTKDIITSHAAFAYLAEEYGLNQVSIAGLSPDEEPSAQKLADIAQFVKKNNIKYIFFENLISPKSSETIADEVGAKTLVLDPIEGISDDNISAGKNYFTIMVDNLKNLRIALGCELK